MRPTTQNLLPALQRKDLRAAYQAGRDCALHGANTDNCHFTHFATPELAAEWSRGNASAKPDDEPKKGAHGKRLKVSFTFPQGLDHVERRMLVAFIKRLANYQAKRKRRTLKASKF